MSTEIRYQQIGYGGRVGNRSRNRSLAVKKPTSAVQQMISVACGNTSRCDIDFEVAAQQVGAPFVNGSNYRQHLLIVNGEVQIFAR